MALLPVERAAVLPPGLGKAFIVGVALLYGVAAAAAAYALTLGLWAKRKGEPCRLEALRGAVRRGARRLAAAAGAVRERFGTSDRKKVLVLGLDNAGKTTLCNHLAYRRGYCWPLRTPRPEHHVLHHHAVWYGCALHLLDPSGDAGHHDQRLKLWEELLKSRPDAVIFIADAADAARHSQAQDALHWALRHPALQQLPVLVLGTKIDLRGALDTWELKCSLGLAGLSTEQREALLGRAHLVRGMPIELRRRIAGFHPNQAVSPPHGGPIALRMCSLKRPGSHDAGMRWLVENLRTSGGSGGRACRWPARLCRSCWPASVGTLGRVLRSSAELSRQAGLLPMYEA